MPIITFEFSDPTPDGVDIPATGSVRCSLYEREPTPGGYRSTAAFRVPLTDGAAEAALSAGVWHIAVDGVEGIGERWVLVPAGAGPVPYKDVPDADLTTIPVTPETVPRWADLDARVTAVEAGTGVTIEDDPDFRWAAILTVGVTVSAPAVTGQPTSQATTPGQPVTFTAAATGSPTPTATWQENDGTGWVNVGAESAPTVTQHPAPQTVPAATPVTFTAAATGSPTPTIQWQSNDGTGWSNIMGATSSSYTIPSPQLGDSGKQYRAVFSNGVSPDATTNAATLTVSAVAPTITTASLNALTKGSAFSQTIAATGTSPITWAVQSGTLPAGLSLNATTGAITGTPSASGAYAFTLRATNSAGFDDQAYSGSVNASGSAPVVTLHPQSQTINDGDSITLTAAASGTAPIDVQWFTSLNNGVSWSPITGATSTTYASGSIYAGGPSPWFKATFNNAFGSTDTNAAVITVNGG